MQLQPPVKREPFRPPPREPDEPTAGELAEEVLEDDGNPVAEAPREAAAVLAETVVEPAAAIEVSTTIEVQVVAVNETPAISPAPPAAEPSGVPETTGIPESTGTPRRGSGRPVRRWNHRFSRGDVTFLRRDSLPPAPGWL
jgi:hypothetical protein